MVTAYILYGQGIGCHEECGFAYKQAGAQVEFIHINELISGAKRLAPKQILNMSGGFLHGDNLGAGMLAANAMDHSVIEGKRLKDVLVDFAATGGIIYGQCNGFQVLVKTGLLPGINNNYSKQTVTLTHNACGSYRVAPVKHVLERPHFAFNGVDPKDLFLLWCRHGEGRLLFHADGGLVSFEEGERRRDEVNTNHVLLRYVTPDGHTTQKFPDNPNQSEDAIAGLRNLDDRIFGHMAHTETSVFRPTEADWFAVKEQLRRQGIKAADLTPERLKGTCAKIFENIVNYAKQQ